MLKTKVNTREEWLQKAICHMEPVFQRHGYAVPAVRVACGWPSSRALSANKRTLGECWSKTASSDKVAQIFISPYLIKPAEPQGVLATLLHEVVHAVVGQEEKHNKVFGKCAHAVGLEGKLTATFAGPALIAQCEGWVKLLGEYPHAQLDSAKRPVKKQTTRLVKCECGKCGYVARTTRKWIDECGPVVCPCNLKPMKYEIAEELEGDDDE
jgi:hypothetical protein